MRTLLFLLALALSLPLVAAPAPQPRPRQVTPGTWLLVFAGSTYTMTLHADGGYTATNGSTMWSGSWAFSQDSRLFLIHEHCGEASANWLQFVVKMDPHSLVGRVVTTGGGTGVLVEIRSR